MRFFTVIVVILFVIIFLVIEHIVIHAEKKFSTELEDSFDNMLTLIHNKTPFGFAHYNDGEMDCVKKVTAKGVGCIDGDTWKGSGGGGKWKDSCDNDTRHNFYQTLDNPPDNFYIGVACSKCHPGNNETAMSIISETAKIIPAMTFHHTIFNYNGKNKLLDAVRDRHIFLVISDSANDDFFRKNFSRVDTIRVPSNFASQKFGEMRDTNYGFGKNDIVFLLCGPLGRLLAPVWCRQYPETTFLCLGSYFDKELYGKVTASYATGLHKYCPKCFPYKRSILDSVMYFSMFLKQLHFHTP